MFDISGHHVHVDTARLPDSHHICGVRPENRRAGGMVWSGDGHVPRRLAETEVTALTSIARRV